MRVEELLSELADAPAPPSDLTAKDAYAAGRHRRRVLAAARLATATAVVVVLTVTATLTIRWNADGRNLPAAPTHSPTPTVQQSPTPPPSLGGTIRNMQAYGDHLYAIVGRCAKLPCESSETSLLGSDDGGRTWTVRATNIDYSDSLTVVGPQTLLVWHDLQPQISTDGGRTMRSITDTRAPVDGIPDGAYLGNLNYQHIPSGKLCAFDPDKAWLAPLKQGPDLTESTTYLKLPDLPGNVLAVTGYQRGTLRPLVSLSWDRGHTWHTHVFTDAPALRLDFDTDLATVVVEFGSLASTDSKTIYAVLTPTTANLKRTQAPLVYRTDDGGTSWQRVDRERTLPAVSWPLVSYVRPDGAHVVVDPAGQFWVSHDRGGRYTRQSSPLPLPAERGLPARSGATPITVKLKVTTDPDRGTWYLAWHSDGIYRSTDGETWSVVAVK